MNMNMDPAAGSPWFTPAADPNYAGLRAPRGQPHTFHMTNTPAPPGSNNSNYQADDEDYANEPPLLEGALRRCVCARERIGG